MIQINSFEEVLRVSPVEPFDKKIKFFQGKVKCYNKTKNGNIYIKGCDVKLIKVREECNLFVNVGEYGFLIPKRRRKLYNDFIETMDYEKSYIFKLLEEPRSQKMTVSIIFEVGKN